MLRIFLLLFAFSALASVNVYAGLAVVETDTQDYLLVGAFDLRDRETFVQITNTSSAANLVHIQIFNVADNCNENDFFDNYTPSDTHTYNLRDIVTNDGNPSGVVLPSDAYGIFIAFFNTDDPSPLNLGIGNVRIQDNNGYEYRTNLNGVGVQDEGAPLDIYTFNYNTESGVTLSDLFGFGIDFDSEPQEAFAADITEHWASFDVDIFNLDEVPFSCRNVIFACTDQDNPLLPALLEESGDASVASFEWGINDAIPSSKGAPLLCPNNIVSEGFVRLDEINYGDLNETFVLFVGLNNGNGRGTMDSIWYDSGVNPSDPT